MQTFQFATWEKLQQKVDEFQAERKSLSEARQSEVSELLFRGQANASWPLQTTLERTAPQISLLRQYFRLISITKPQIETLTTHRWDLDDYPALEKWASQYNNLKLDLFPGYDYLVYLRHHGFPSPLLDWTRSLSIAAFFAFQSADAEDVAIYVFSEYRGRGKSSASDKPQIVSFGPYVRSHPRHFNQQSSYTLCCEFGNGPWKFAAHDRVHDVSPNDQDCLWKLTVPASEKLRVLRILDSTNINAYTLFQTEEALLQTIAMRELKFRDREL